MEKSKLRGKLDIIIGPMFSGKTSELLRRMRRYKLANFKCLIVKYAEDIRYSNSNISSHDGQELPAVASLKLMELREMAQDCDIIGIDEAQFFSDLIEFCKEQLENGKMLVVSGLDATFKRTGFDNVLNLIPMANSVEKLSAICMSCGSKASFSKRIVQDTEVILIGGLDKYMAVCRKCYKLDCPVKSAPFIEMYTNGYIKLPENELPGM